MPKLPVLKSKQVVKKLEKLGFVKNRQAGSHIILLHKQDGRRAVIPLHVSDLPKGTLAAILRESRISRDDFMDA